MKMAVTLLEEAEVVEGVEAAIEAAIEAIMAVTEEVVVEKHLGIFPLFLSVFL
jgi:hypothetical protein